MTTASHFEALKIAFRQTKDGVVISLAIHPNEVSPALMALPIGARVMIGWCEIGEDENPKADPVVQRIECETPNLAVAGSTPAGVAKAKRAFKDLSLPEQAGIRCEDKTFVAFLRSQTPPEWWEISNLDAASVLRAELGIQSRAELSHNHDAANRWREIERVYQNHLAQLQYAESRR